MELSQLRYFVAVAEELNFRRAAERCFVAQPALSRSIQRLEAELGVQLVYRTKRVVALTEAGRVFLAAVHDGLARLDAGALAASRLSERNSSLTIGTVEYAGFPFLPRVLQRFGEEYPETRILRVDMPPQEHVEALRNGTVDVAFQGVVRKHDGLAYLPIMQAAWGVAVPVAHRFAQCTHVSAEDLVGKRLILFPRYVNPGLYDWIVGRVGTFGPVPRIVQEPAQLHVAVRLVAAEMGVFPSPFTVDDLDRDTVVVRPLIGFDRDVQICAVYRKGDRSVRVQRFLDAVRTVSVLVRTGEKRSFF